jgi:hypothetical protein
MICSITCTPLAFRPTFATLTAAVRSDCRPSAPVTKLTLYGNLPLGSVVASSRLNLTAALILTFGTGWLVLTSLASIVNHAMALVVLVLVYAVLLVMLIVMRAGLTQGSGLGLGDGKMTVDGLGDGLGDVTAGDGDGDVVGGAATLYTATHVTDVAGCNSSKALPTLLSLLDASSSSVTVILPDTWLVLLLLLLLLLRRR